MRSHETTPLIESRSSQAHMTRVLVRRNQVEDGTGTLEWLRCPIMNEIVRCLSFLDAVSLAATSYQLQRTLLACDATFHLSWPSKSDDAKDSQSSGLHKPTIRDMIKSLNEITATEAISTIFQAIPTDYYSFPERSSPYLLEPYKIAKFIDFYLYAQDDLFNKAPPLVSNIAQSDCSKQLLESIRQCECWSGCALCVGCCITETVNICDTWGEINPIGHATDYSCCGWSWCSPPDLGYSSTCATNCSCGCAHHCDGLFHGIACLSQQGCFNCVGLLGIAMCGLATVTCLLAAGLNKLEDDVEALRRSPKEKKIEEQRSKLNEIMSSQPVISLLFEKTKARLEKELKDETFPSPPVRLHNSC